MRKTFGSPLSGLFRSLPTIVAELNETMICRERGSTVCHDRGSRAYLVMSDPNPLESETVECLLRTKMNQFRLRDVPWRVLRFIELTSVPAVIGERCWRGSKREMEEMVTRIREEKLVRVNNFAPDVDL
jgi:hypothetical protein